jgi:hypothetical protein
MSTFQVLVIILLTAILLQLYASDPEIKQWRRECAEDRAYRREARRQRRIEEGFYTYTISRLIAGIAVVALIVTVYAGYSSHRHEVTELANPAETAARPGP